MHVLRFVARPFIVLIIVCGAGATLHAQANQPPKVAVTSPASGATFNAPAFVTVGASASDSDGTIRAVKFHAGETHICDDTTAPYGCLWTASVAGTYGLTATAIDNRGKRTRSAPVSITVKSAGSPTPAPSPAPATPPTVSITSPNSGSSFVAPAAITIAATAQVTSGTITRVAFYAGALLIGSSTASPYSVTWSNAQPGSYSLTAQATDSAGQTATSAAVAVTVSAANVRPTVSITSPAAGASFTAPASIAITASASDSDGSVKQVAFYAGTTMVGSLVNSPYSFTWQGVPAGTYSLTAVVEDNTGATTTSAAVGVTVSAAPVATPAGQLIQPSNLVYQGAFRAPGGTHGSTLVSGHNVSTFAYGGTALAFSPERNSLFMVGHDWGQLVAEIGIPAIRNSASAADLAEAPVLQSFADPTAGRMPTVNPGNTIKVGGLLPYKGQLYLSAYDYFDAAASQVYSHFVTSPILSQKSVLGPFAVNAPMAGFVSGYFGLVPSEWQSAFGGPVINGNCCLAIVSRTSYGPSLFAIDPTRLGVADPLPAAPLVYYPSTNPLGEWDSTNVYYNGTTQVTGVVFPAGWRSVLFIGRQGTGPFCYGPGTSDPALAGKPADGTDTWCYDPVYDSKGTHAYPYRYQVWAYDANDLAAAKRGERTPWSVKPYAVWALPLPFSASPLDVGGATYDPDTGRIFVSQQYGNESLPVIHVFAVH